MTTATLPQRDAYDLTQEIDEDQRRLGELDLEQKGALQAVLDARHQLLIADTQLKAVKGTIDIIKSRLIAKQSLLKAIPR